MKFTFTFLPIAFLLVIATSCIEHEVIPPPVSTVNLNCSFSGYVNGTQIELTQNVNGYLGNTQNIIDVNPSPNPSFMVYMTEMLSPNQPLSLRLKLGACNWDAAANTEPTLTMFNNFHTNSAINLQDYADNVNAFGFEVTYTDNNSSVWVSRELYNVPNSVTFSNIKQQSDNTGDYSFFDCNFSCYVYRVNPISGLLDSLQMQNGKYSGYFKK